MRLAVSIVALCMVACAHAPPQRTVVVAVLPPPRPAGPAPIVIAPSHQGESCGDLALDRAELRARGKGERHPEVLEVEAALAKCQDRTPSAEACARVLRDREAMVARGYGPAHPEMVVAAAKLALCGDSKPMPPPSAEECAALRRDRATLVAEGKGERHPRMLEVDARLADCP